MRRARRTKWFARAVPVLLATCLAVTALVTAAPAVDAATPGSDPFYTPPSPLPAGQPGEMISTFEMLMGQIFLVTLVAGLVAVWRPGTGLKQRRERRAGQESGPGRARPIEPGELSD